MEKIRELIYGPYTTEVYITENVKEFLKGLDIDDILFKSFDSDEWYQGWLLRYLDKDKDSIPDKEFLYEFQMIYCGIIQNPEDYFDAEDILLDLEIDPDNLIFDGSITINENPQTNKTKFWIRWIVVKKSSGDDN